MNGKSSSIKGLRTLLIASAVLIVLIVLAAFIALTTGASAPGVSELAGLIAGGGRRSGELSVIFFKLRLPRILFAAAIGMALASSGACFQAVLRNPLAEPYLLGVSSGAAVGAIAAIRTGWGDTAAVLFPAAFAGGIITILIVYFIASARGGIDTYRMILAGVIINAFLSSVILFFFSVSESWDIQTIMFWMMGNLGMNGLGMALVLLPATIAGLAALFALSGSMNILMSGEETALALGIRVEAVKLWCFIIASLLTALCVAAGGVIGFVGLIIPHAVRLVWGYDNRLVIPLSALLGALFLITADTAARTVISPNELPIGVITAFTGTPVFLALLIKNRMK